MMLRSEQVSSSAMQCPHDFSFSCILMFSVSESFCVVLLANVLLYLCALTFHLVNFHSIFH